MSKALLPVLILGYILGVLICTKFFYPQYGIQETFVMLFNSIWEFLGFHAAGLRSLGGEFFNLNGPLWFISAMIIVGYFIKYLVGVIKANKERRRIIKLKLNEDIEDDGTN